jgi:hypothetical protein
MEQRRYNNLRLLWYWKSKVKCCRLMWQMEQRWYNELRLLWYWNSKEKCCGLMWQFKGEVLWIDVAD